jgi:hypothetical protein
MVGGRKYYCISVLHIRKNVRFVVLKQFSPAFLLEALVKTVITFSFTVGTESKELQLCEE